MDLRHIWKPAGTFLNTPEKTKKEVNDEKGNTQIRQKFTQEEDELLRKLVAELGDYDWNTIASRMNGRTPRQCRERYRNYLSPSLVNGPWTQDEELLLIQKFRQHGPRWAKIVQYFKNRSDVNIKNHWASISHRIAKMNQIRNVKKEIINGIDASVKASVFLPIPQITIPPPQKVESPSIPEKPETLHEMVSLNGMFNIDLMDPFEFQNYDM